jgi:hypothetical protein
VKWLATWMASLGTVRTDPSVVKRLFDRQLMAGSRVGYLHQLLAGSTLHLHSGGHVDLMTTAAELAPVVEMFRRMD